MSLPRKILTFVAVMMFLQVSASFAAARVVTFAVVEGSTPGATSSEFQPLMQHLASASRTINIELKTFPTNDAVFAAFKAKKVDLALLGAVKYVEAHNEMSVMPIVAEGEKLRSYIVPAASPIKTVEQLKGKWFAFGYPDSTTTHLMPLLLLSKHGLHKEDVQSRFIGHQPQELIDQMLAGKFAAAPAAEHVYGQNKTKVRAIEQSDPIPGPPVVAQGDFDPKLAAEIRQMFVSYKATGDAVKRRFGSGATAVTDADYNRIRFLCKVLFNKTYH